jgi:hypothetical protein
LRTDITSQPAEGREGDLLDKKVFPHHSPELSPIESLVTVDSGRALPIYRPEKQCILGGNDRANQLPETVPFVAFIVTEAAPPRDRSENILEKDRWTDLDGDTDNDNTSG